MTNVYQHKPTNTYGRVLGYYYVPFVVAQFLLNVADVRHFKNLFSV